ncbi:MAG TPA: phosphodiester glycosidase family protein [Solirubrobacteraceae bacterium]|nr:phosphodiester glycosidase family protein [Solirubrobacteraceae bacterium]
MGSQPITVHRRLPYSGVLTRRPARLERFRARLSDGAGTTVHLASYAREAFSPRVVVLDEPAPLVRWCLARGTRDALVGGFFQRPDYRPLGELRLAGRPADFVPFLEPWGARRGCLHIADGRMAVAARDQLGPEPAGDLLQAGPVLVLGGRSVLAAHDPEGFSTGSEQFDSDITDGRYPRAAVGLTDDRVLAVACDGRNGRDAGMTLSELADLLVMLGAGSALNLDGGGSASLVHDGRLRNRPREQHGLDLLDGRPVVTALVFEPRG